MRLDSVLLQKVREVCKISPLIPEEESGSFGEVTIVCVCGGGPVMVTHASFLAESTLIL